MATIFTLYAIPNVAFAATEQYASPELQRAVTLGIGAYSKNTNVTYQQFFKMLDVAVNLSDPHKLDAWKAKFSKARTSTQGMTRQEGMLAVYYAAEILGEEYYEYNASPDWSITNELIGDSCWDDLTWNYPLFPEWNQPTTLVNPWDNHMIAAFFYSFGRESLYSGETIFDFDPVSVSMRPNQLFTYEEGLLAALRLHDSELPSVLKERVPTQEDKAFLELSNARRETILNNNTKITVTGTSYYVSNNGNDLQDGLTPATAWATLNKINTTDLKSGDGVFFERGGLWRSEPWQAKPPHCDDGVLYAQKGVTYSAYGEGEKPKIFGSPENGADPTKWKLLDSTKNIWVFYKDIQDCGGIIFNYGMSMALKTCAFWDGSQYYKSSDGRNVDIPRIPLDVKSLENLRFFNEIYYPGKEAGGYFSTKGKLYLRCDKGNPGSVYSSIEFITGNNDWNQGFVSGQEGNVIDNICFLYGTGASLLNNCLAQNCEFGWIGGQILDYSATSLGDDTEGVIVRCGDGIMIFGDNNSIRNNYIHHVYDNGITIEGFSASSEISAWKRENSIITGNIIEACYGGLLVADWYAWNKLLNHPSFNNIRIDDNYFIRSGYGWSHQDTGDYTGSLTLYFHPGSLSNINISNNVFYLSKYALVVLSSESEGMRPVFSANTYVQNEFGDIINRKILNSSIRKDQAYKYNASSLISVDNVLGDKSAMFFDQPKPSSWATDGVGTGISRGIATPDLRNGYSIKTTRAEFCVAAVNFLEIYYKKPIADVLKEKGLEPLSFNDIQDDAISAAAALGLTSGTGNGNFSPHNSLSREQAATMLSNTLKCIGIDITEFPDADFTDNGSFSTWAVDAINALYASGIMSGTSSTPKVFSPKGAYTHEQSILSFNNMYNYLTR